MNVPLVDDSVALRASYASNDLAGYVDNLVDGRKDINDGKQTSGRASLLWQNDAASVQFSAMQQKIDSDNNAAIALDPVTFKPVAGLSNYIYVDEPFKKDLDYYSLDGQLGRGLRGLRLGDQLLQRATSSSTRT